MLQYILHLAALGGIYILLASSLNIIVGLSGQVSLGHAAFFGIGAYTSALLSQSFPGIPFVVLMVFAGIPSLVAALVLSPPALKLKDEYLAVVTLGFGIICELTLKNLDVTGGPDGLYGLTNFGMSPGEFIIPIWTWGIACMLITWRLNKGQFGRNLTAIRESENTAMTMGISPLPIKVLCFGISAFFAGVAGCLYAHFITFIQPGVFGLSTSILLLCMVVLGGMGTVLGPVVGAILLFLLPEFLQALADYQELVYGLLLILTLIFRPQGIVGKKTGNGQGMIGECIRALRGKKSPDGV
ncbi:MAG: branched-chain amino acid ABC transporter permease [Desulfoplanes sp.]